MESNLLCETFPESKKFFTTISVWQSIQPSQNIDTLKVLLECNIELSNIIL